MPSVVIYARVSTNDQRQDLGVQVHACTEYAERAGLTVRQVYQDHAPARDLGHRFQWRALLADLRRWQPRQRPTAIVAVRLDRCARSLHDYVTTQRELDGLGVRLVTVDGVLGHLGEEDAAYHRLLAHIMAAVAEFELELIRERINDGLDYARAKGTRLGRPPQGIDWDTWAALPEGLSVRQRAQALGVNYSTLARAERELAAAESAAASS